MAVRVTTTKRFEVLNLTSNVIETIPSEIDHGICTVFTPHTTTGIVVNESENRLLSDIERAIERLVPRETEYEHNAIDDNADSHLRSILLGESVTIPIVNGSLGLGTWQAVLLVECDGPRTRRVEVTTVPA